MTFVPDSPEAVRAFLEAEDIASRANQPLSSAHLLLALFTFPNRAQALLLDRGISEDTILEHIRVLEDEPKRIVQKIRDRGRELAGSSASEAMGCLHMLIALTRMRDAFAYRLLERCGTSLTALRNIAVSYVTGHMPRRIRTMSNTPPEQRAPAPKIRTSPAHVVEREIPPHPALLKTIAEPEPADEFSEIEEAVEQATPAPAPAPITTTLPKPQWPSAKPAPAGKQKLEDIAPTLASCAIDLTNLARQGELDPAIGRDRELEALIDTLGKRRANNPVLVGPPGVGKTAVVEGLACKIAKGDDDVVALHECFLVSLDTGALVAGTSLRGAFSEKLGAIKEEVAAAQRQIVVFIDELHTLIGAGTSGEGPQDAANELKAALARGEFPCIGATTHDEFRKYIEKDPALERRFTPIFVEEPSPDEAILILESAVAPYAEHHQVDYSIEALHAAVQLTHRFVTERKLPDKAFAAIDLAGSRARRRGARKVERLDIARVINEWTGVPLERLAEADAERFNRAETLLGEKLIGHHDVVKATAKAIRRGLAGFGGHRPLASLLFLGPTGVGKTELVKVLAEFLFGRRDAIVRMDMSELSEAHSVARLIGAQPGYVGYEEGGQLTEALRKRPFQIVLFDEIEKAHKDVLNVLLQILDEGQLTDSKGRRVSFANTVIALTSNLGAEKFSSGARTIGFGGASGKNQEVDSVLEAARSQIAPELWGRLDERLVFKPLTEAQVRQIAVLQIKESSRLLFSEREVGVEWDDAVIDFLLTNGGFSLATGARGMRQTIQRFIEAPLAEEILAGNLRSGDIALIKVDQNSIRIRPKGHTRRHAIG